VEGSYTGEFLRKVLATRRKDEAPVEPKRANAGIAS